MLQDIALKALFLVLILIGEAMAIYSEVIAAKEYNNLRTMAWMLWWITVAGFFLIPGYMLGMKMFKDIWLVSVVSIVCVLICEPILVWSVFKEVPSLGSILGFVFGMVGFACTMFIR